MCDNCIYSIVSMPSSSWFVSFSYNLSWSVPTAAYIGTNIWHKMIQNGIMHALYHHTNIGAKRYLVRFWTVLKLSYKWTWKRWKTVSKKLKKESHEHSICFPSLDVVKSLFKQPLTFCQKQFTNGNFKSKNTFKRCFHLYSSCMSRKLVSKFWGLCYRPQSNAKLEDNALGTFFQKCIQLTTGSNVEKLPFIHRFRWR